MKYKHSRNYIAKLIDERMTGFCGMKTVDERCKRVLNAVCGDLIPLLYATKPTKVKKIKKLSLTTPYWLITENGEVEEIDKTKFITDKINEIIDLLNTINETVNIHK